MVVSLAIALFTAFEKPKSHFSLPYKYIFWILFPKQNIRIHLLVSCGERTWFQFRGLLWFLGIIFLRVCIDGSLIHHSEGKAPD